MCTWICAHVHVRLEHAPPPKPSSAAKRSSIASVKASELTLGERCLVQLPNKPDRLGTVRYIGTTTWDNDNQWVGVELDEALGKHDGMAEGRRYFTCPQGHGSMVPIAYVHKAKKQ